MKSPEGTKEKKLSAETWLKGLCPCPLRTLLKSMSHGSKIASYATGHEEIANGRLAMMAIIGMFFQCLGQKQ